MEQHHQQWHRNASSRQRVNVNGVATNNGSTVTEWVETTMAEQHNWWVTETDGRQLGTA